jgi:elongation factor P hydroxylase
LILYEEANLTFHISADNLSADIGAINKFVQAVVMQARRWCCSPMPERAALLVSALSNLFCTSPFALGHYQMGGDIGQASGAK